MSLNAYAPKGGDRDCLARRRLDPAHRIARFPETCRAPVARLAASHERLADLLWSFPGLLFALAVPSRGRDRSAATAAVIAGRSLDVAARLARVPRWLRRLPPEAFDRPLSVHLPDDDVFRRRIGNEIPKQRTRLPGWLAAVATAQEAADSLTALWIAREVRLRPGTAKLWNLKEVCLWTWFSRHPQTFAGSLAEKPWTPDLQIDEAKDRVADWSSDLLAHLLLNRMSGPDPWLQPMTVAGIAFRPILTSEALHAEARAMQHCVRTYATDIAQNRSRLFSLQKDGRRLATLEVQNGKDLPFLAVTQLKGVRNTVVDDPAVWQAVLAWQFAQVRAARPKEALQNKVFDQPTWRRLWRPYWLEKRRIPDWLPLHGTYEVFQKL